MDKKHLLVVDDDINLLKTLEFILMSANYKVTAIANSQEALEKIVSTRRENLPIDLLILDIRMPRLTGLQLIDELHRLGVKIPTVAITAYGNQELADELKRKGGVDYLEKTLDEEALVKCIDSILARPQTQNTQRK